MTEVKETLAFKELKKRMKNDMDDEMYEDDKIFYRFLKARDFKVDNAEYMLRQHLEWRKKFDLKNILKHKLPDVLGQHFILTKIGYDKEGRIVKYYHLTDVDFRGIFESVKIDDWLRCLIQHFEKDVLDLKRQNEKLGKPVDKIIYIVNAANFGLAKATDRKVIVNLGASISMYSDNYPETLKTIYVINAPSYFNVFYTLMKPLLASAVIQKIKVYSDDNYKKDLLEAIDADVLPAFLGGNRTDPDGNPMCLTFIKTPEPVPKSCYLSKYKQSFVKLPDVEKVTVPKSELHEVCLEVKTPGHYLEWEFQLKSGDIKFGISYRDYEGKKYEIFPLEKKNTNESTESGLYRCDKAGTYIVVFDNSYSFLRSKEIYYKIKVEAQSEILLNNQA